MSIRIITPTNADEWAPFERVIAASFGHVHEASTAEEVERAEIETPFAMRIGVMEGDRILGACESYEFDLSLPGGCSVSAAGLTGVGGDPTLRGRGLLRAVITEHLQRAKARGHAVSILNASEAGLYGRFGYGHATSMVGYEVDSGRADYRQPLDDAGSFELVHDLLGNSSLFASAYDRAAAVVPGTGARSELWWQRVLGKKESWRGGGKQLGVLHRDANGEPDGYLLYAIKEKPSWVNEDELTIRELTAASVTTELALFEFATKIPLQRKVLWPEGPADFPARHHMADPRQLHVVDEHDLLWLRPLNVQELVSSRTYAADGSIVFDIDDDIFDDQRGPWKVDIVDGVAEVTTTDEVSRVTLTPAQLGMIVLGEHRVQDLVHAGVLDGDPAMLRRLDLAFLTDRRPYNLSKF